MNTELDLERRLRTHLAAEADGRPADGALEAVLAVTASTRPRRLWHLTVLASVAPRLGLQPGARPTGGAAWILALLGLLGLLFAIALGATLIGTQSPQRLIVPPSPPLSPAAIAYHQNGAITNASGLGVIAIDPVTGAQSVISTGPAEYADWSPDGRRLATVNGGKLLVLDTTTGTTATVPSTVLIRSPIAWSPDGTSVAYVDLDGVHVVDVVSGVDTHLPAAPGSLGGTAILQGRPSWTPTGQAVRYTNAGETFSTHADGSGAEVLGPLPLGVVGSLAWAPDGTRFAYFLDPSQEPAPTGGDPFVLQLWVAHADGTHATDVSEQLGCCLGINPIGPIWSPDGTQIAFNVGTFGLEVVNPATRGARNLGTNPSGELGWRPVP
jgi:hypothetical protein